MADFTSKILALLLSSNQAAKEAAGNQLWDAATPAMLYARNPATSTGLTWGYIGGRYATADIANGTIALTNTATNYIVATKASGAVSVSTGTTDWNNSATYDRLYSVVTAGGVVTDWTDHREMLGGGGGGGGGGGLTLIQRQVASGSPSSISFTSISSAYEDLQLVFMARGTNASLTTGFNLRMNNDTASNYGHQDHVGASSSSFSTQTLSDTKILLISGPAASAAASYVASGRVLIPSYARTTFFKSALTQKGEAYDTAGTAMETGTNWGQWRSTSAINRLDIFPDAGNWVDGSVFSLYGIS